MAEVTMGSVCAVTNPQAFQANSLVGVAGEDLEACEVVYLKAADGRFWLADGGAADAEALAFGFVVKDASAGETCSIALHGVNLNYGPEVSDVAVSPGTRLYLSGTVDGGLADAASTGGTTPVAITLPDGRIRVLTM